MQKTILKKSKNSQVRCSWFLKMLKSSLGRKDNKRFFKEFIFTYRSSFNFKSISSLYINLKGKFIIFTILIFFCSESNSRSGFIFQLQT